MSDTVHLVAPMAKDAVEMFVNRRETFTAYDVTVYLRKNLTLKVDHNYAVRPVVHATMQDHLDSGEYTRSLKVFPGGEAWVYEPVAQQPQVRMVEVDSTAIHKVGYDPDKQLLYLQFHSGKFYTYKDVGPVTYTDLMTADSIGGYFNRYIRRNYGVVED